MPTAPDESSGMQGTLSLLSDRWNLRIIHLAITDQVTKFNDFRDRLGAAPNVLSERLSLLVAAGLFERVPYKEGSDRTRQQYLLTDTGSALRPTIDAMRLWSEDCFAAPVVDADARPTDG